MKKEIVMWVDHRKAVIATIENEIAVTREVKSNMEKHVSYSNGDHEKSSMDSPGPNAEDVQEWKLKNHLRKYYKALITHIRDADSIWIFGSVKAKAELRNHLERDNLGGKIMGI